jgi:hypothetical protein
MTAANITKETAKIILSSCLLSGPIGARPCPHRIFPPPTGTAPQPRRLDHPRPTVCSFASQPRREGVNKGFRDRPALVESADVRGHGCGAESNDATMRTPVHTHRLPCRRCHGIDHSGDVLILPLCIGIGSNPPPWIASVDLLNFQDRRVWLITRSPHRYPGGPGLQPGHEPVCSDLTESLSAHNVRLILQRKPCTGKAESGDHPHRRWCAIADP